MKSKTKIAIFASIFASTGLIIGLLVLAGIIPIKYVWGGRITHKSQLLPLESVTFITNALIIWFIGMRAGYFKLRVKQTVIRTFLLAFGILMLINTAGNLVAKTNTEKLFAIPTLLGTVCFVFLYRKNPEIDKQ